MNSEEKILKEIQELKKIVAQLIGGGNLSEKEKFSNDALKMAAKQFREMAAKRGEWIKHSEFKKYIKSAPYDAGKFIREEFGFTNYFKKSHDYYYNKEEIIALGKELKERNIDLSRYMELKNDQAIFEKCIASVRSTGAKKPPRPFNIPENLRDILKTPTKLPDLSIMQAELQKLKDEFFENKLDEYIDIYKSNYAIVKQIYYFEKYLEPKKRMRFSRWCNEFNVVNRILEEITGKKVERFIPVPKDKIIEL